MQIIKSPKTITAKSVSIVVGVKNVLPYAKH